MTYNFAVPCIMGTEGLVADELKFGGFQNVRAENARVLFDGDEGECARANITLRCGERVLLRMGSFRAETFDALFEGTKALPWEEFVGSEDAFPVKGHAIGSKLFSIPDCQKIIKKAAVERLRLKYGVDWFAETGAKRQIQFAIMNDVADIYIDTSGDPLFKRGYKLESNLATIRETLAASMVKLARYRGRESFIDPFCGSGTIAIEAAMAALNIAPGARRVFDAQRWNGVFTAAFDRARENAKAAEKHEQLPIIASDIDPAAIAMTRENARRAGVLSAITVEEGNALERSYSPGILMANPPYGVRMLDVEQARQLYHDLGEKVAGNEQLKKYIISSDDTFEECFGKRSDKRRKLYNGMIKCNLYMYFK